MGQPKFSVTDLLLISSLAGTDGPVKLSAGGLWARGGGRFSSSGASVVSTSTVSTGWIWVSVETNNKNREICQ